MYKRQVYRKIVFWISNQRTWIDVVDADMYGVFAFLYSCLLYTSLCMALMSQAERYALTGIASDTSGALLRLHEIIQSERHRLSELPDAS